MDEALRVSRRVVVGFPNFAHIKARVQLFFRGATPVTNALPHLWYNTPNLHFLTISDFEAFTAKRKIKVLERYFYTHDSLETFRSNLFAMNAIFVITREQMGGEQ